MLSVQRYCTTEEARKTLETGINMLGKRDSSILTREQRALSHVITFVTFTLQLGEEHGCVLLPFLVVLAITVALVILLLAHGNARDL